MPSASTSETQPLDSTFQIDINKFYILEPYACYFAIKSSWRMQSNALDRSTINIPIFSFLSKLIFSLFFNLKRACCAL